MIDVPPEERGLLYPAWLRRWVDAQWGRWQRAAAVGDELEPRPAERLVFGQRKPKKTKVN